MTRERGGFGTLGACGLPMRAGKHCTSGSKALKLLFFAA